MVFVFAISDEAGNTTAANATEH